MQPASTLFNHFDRVRIISLPRRSDRRRESLQELARIGLPVDGDRIAFFDAIEPTDAAGFPNRAVRGCFLSHLAVLEDARRDGIRRVLILEDDIAFIRDITQLAGVALSELDTLDWDLAYLGHALGQTGQALAWHPVTHAMRDAHFYAVNATVYDRLIAFLRAVLSRPGGHPDGGPMHYDGALSTFVARDPDIRAVYFSRNLGYQRPSRTDLHRVSILDRSQLFAPVRWLYRRAKRAYLHATR